MESGMGEVVLTLVKLDRDKFQYKSVSSNILFWRKFTLTKTSDVGLNFLVVDLALC